MKGEFVESDHWDDDRAAASAAADPQAFAVLYRRYVTGVFRYLYGKVGSRADAEDLTSQTFVACMEALPAYRRRGKFAAWLFSIARRKAADYHRKNPRQQELPLEDIRTQADIPDDPLSKVVQDEQQSRLRALYTQLDEHEQELIRLRYAAGLTYAQIGQVLGKNEAAVGMALHRLTERLRHELGKQEENHGQGE